MIKIGKYSIEDWSIVDKYLDYDYIECERKLLYNDNETSYSISIRTNFFLKKESCKIWHIHYGLIEIKSMFLKLYDNKICYFNNPIEAKDFVDFSLEKLRKLRLFL